MKKKKLITLCIAAVAVIFGYGGMKAYKNVGNNNLMLANVEALTQGDEPSAKSWPCWSELKKGMVFGFVEHHADIWVVRTPKEEKVCVLNNCLKFRNCTFVYVLC